MHAALTPEQLQAPELLLVPDKVMLRDGPVSDYGLLIARGQFREVAPAAEVMERFGARFLWLLCLFIAVAVSAGHLITAESRRRRLALVEPAGLEIAVEPQGALRDSGS